MISLVRHGINICNPSIQEAEATSLETERQSGLNREAPHQREKESIDVSVPLEVYTAGQG